MLTDPSPPTPAQLNRRSSLAMLLALVAASLMGLLAWGPVELSHHTHVFADQRAWLGIPNASNVLSHLPLIPLGLWGLHRVSQLQPGESLRAVWALFFSCQILATFGGMIYHWAPSDAVYVWEALPRSAACTFMACAFLAECVDRRWGSPAALLVAFGACVLSGLWWLATYRLSGTGDLRPLLWLEYMPTLLVATGAWNLSGHLLTRQDWQRSLISFVVAQTVDAADGQILTALGWVGGHAIRHLALAACVAWLAYRLGSNLRREAALAAARQRADAAQASRPMEGKAPMPMRA